MYDAPRQVGKYWVRIKNRLVYVGSWLNASCLEVDFKDALPSNEIHNIFIEYMHYPWSRHSNDQYATFYESDKQSFIHYFVPPPRATIIRVTLCDHTNPALLISMFRMASITDILFINAPCDVSNFSEFRIHNVLPSTSYVEIDEMLRAKLKIPQAVLSSRLGSGLLSGAERHSGISSSGKGLYIFTAAAFNYFPKAKLLARSVREHLPDAHLCMALSDVRPAGFNIKKYGFDSVVAADDLDSEIPNLESWIFRHDVMELSTAIKPFVLNRLLDLPDCAAVLFLDPDCYLFGDPADLLKQFESHSILITPHQTKAEIDDRMMFREVNHLRFGIYNLGFLGVKNDDEGKRFAHWWKKRLARYCLIDLQSGLFTDQRWIDHVPVFFNRVKILRDSIYNVACWNFRDRIIQGDPSQSITVDGLPICFFHFAGTNGGFQKYMKWWGRDKDALQRLLDWYLDAVNTLNDEPLFTRNSPYDCYANGESVSFLHRLVYREEQGFEERFPRPYSDVDHDSFFSYVSRLGLPDYTRSDLLFGPQGKLLFHIKKCNDYAESMRAIGKNADLIERARSKLVQLIS